MKHRAICYDDEGRFECVCRIGQILEALDHEVEGITEITLEHWSVESQLKNDVGSVVSQHPGVDEPVDGRLHGWKACAGILRPLVPEVGDSGDDAPF